MDDSSEQATVASSDGPFLEGLMAGLLGTLQILECLRQVTLGRASQKNYQPHLQACEFLEWYTQ
jgi:hypothetical protein